MRRTAESLVVLADAPTQHSEQDSLSVAEALQAATAGVQDYQRVRLGPAPDLRLSGSAAPDLVHLFTELVDNALTFSPPTASVTVTTETPAGLVLVQIHDQGLGIDQASLLELNETLRTGADVTAETARRMGVFVVSRLARRHGMTVTLERNADGGTTAKVFIPRALLAAATVHEPVVDDAAAPAQAVAPVSLLGDTFRRPDVEVETGSEADPEAGSEVAESQPAEPEHEAPAAREAAPTAPAGNPLDALSAVINANIRLPQRQPGTADQPSELTPVLSVNTPRTPFERQPEPVEEPVSEAADEPAEERVDEPDVAEYSEPEAREDHAAEHEEQDEVEQDDHDEIEEPAAEHGEDHDEELVDEQDDQAEADLAPEPVEEESTDEEPERVPAFALPTRPMSVVPDVSDSPEPARNGVSHGVEATVLRADPLLDKLTSVPSEDDDSPLYQLLRSSWFTTEGVTKGWDSGEADAGWQAADRANESAPSRLSRSGLPVRDPGNRLVPGGVTTATAAVRRDPEAIRARLAAHAAGVAKGRQASGTDHSTLDTTEDVTP
jgi:hypothetical protein